MMNPLTARQAAPRRARPSACGLLLGGLFLLSALLAQGQSLGGSRQNVPATGKQREIRGQVLDAAGRPVKKARIGLVGLDRASFMPLANATRIKGWHWTADAKGRFTARLANESAVAARAQQLVEPVWGRYHLVVLPEAGRPGTVSPPIINRDPRDRNPRAHYPAGEWGAPLLLEDRPLSLTLRLAQGVTVAGVVVNMEEKPVAGVSVGLENDLHADTPTGAGGEIFRQTTLTDAQGHFQMTDAYPRTLTLELGTPGGGAGAPIWLRTRQTPAGPWIEDRLDRLTPTGERTFIGIMMANRPLYTVAGTVTDAATKRPLAGARIIVGVSFHRQPLTWTDQHHFLNASTGPDGKYEIKAETPWIRFVHVIQPGYAKQGRDKGEAGLLAPGTYNFALTPAGK